MQRLRELQRRADQIKQAVASAPPKVAEFRNAVLMTAGQLQQLRTDFQAGFTGLRADNDEMLTEALREINANTDTLLEAGFELSRVDMDLGINRRLIVRLQKVDDVPGPKLHSLVVGNLGRKTVHALLTAIQTAGELAGSIQLSNLTYDQIIVDVGLAPSVRVCWRSVDLEPEEPAAVQTIAPTATPLPLPPPSPQASAFSQSTFFEPKAVPVAGMPVVSQPVVAAVPAETRMAALPAAATPTGAEPSERPSGDWRRSALDRFKKMPDLLKTHR